MPSHEKARADVPGMRSPGPSQAASPEAAEHPASFLTSPLHPSLRASGSTLSPSHVLHLQRTVGNRAVGRMLAQLAPTEVRGAGPARVQRMEFAAEDRPADLAEDLVTLRNWAYRNACWPKTRRMSEWIDRVRGAPGAAGAVDQWTAFNTALDAGNAATAKYRLGVAAASLKTYIEGSYEAALTAGELTEKDRQIDELVRAISPAALGAGTRQAYKDALVAKVIASPRLLQSIKGKGPFAENVNDDDPRPNGVNAGRIRARVDVVRAGGDLFNDLTPGTNQAWQEWRGNDCVFAAILKVVLGDGAPTDEEQDEAMATTLAAHLNLATGPLDDPVIVYLMERLGWPYTGGKNWAQFQAWAAPASTYVLSADTVAGGTSSHVVVATHDGAAWTIYDRQGNRLGRAIDAPPFPNNPLDVWEVRETDAVGEIRTALG